MREKEECQKERVREKDFLCEREGEKKRVCVCMRGTVRERRVSEKERERERRRVCGREGGKEGERKGV